MYNLSRLDPSYIPEMHRFVDDAKNHALRTKTKHIYCPCYDCRNILLFEDTEVIISQREKDVLTVALGNPEHLGRVRGISSKEGWKERFRLE